MRGFVGRRMNVVSEKFISRAMRCIVSAERSRPSSTTASWLPASGFSVKTSTMRIALPMYWDMLLPIYGEVARSAGGAGEIKQVVVPCASSLPVLTAVTLPSAVAIVPPGVTVNPVDGGWSNPALQPAARRR